MQFLLGLVFPAPGTRLHGQGRTATCVATDGAPMPEDIVEEENRFKFALLATTLLLFLAYDFLLLLFLCPVLDLTAASPAGAQSASFFRTTVLAFTAINALLLAFLHTVRHIKVSACCVLVYINVGVWAVSVVCGPISEFLICLVHVPMLGFYQFGQETGVALLGLTLAQSVVYAIACGFGLTPTSGHTLELGVTARLLAMMGSFVLLGLTTCVNERARLQALRKYHETNKRLAKATKTKARFLTHVSHELRTPLHGIVAAGEELIEQLHELSLANEMASIIGECSRHMLSLINDVLDFERMATKQMTIEQIPFNIPEEIESLVKMLMPMAKQKRIELRQIVDVSHPRRVGDPLRFRQMITNLVSNSLKFTPQNGRVTIAVSSRRGLPVDGAAGGGRHAPEGPPQQACVGCCGPGRQGKEEQQQHDEPDDSRSRQQQNKKLPEEASQLKSASATANDRSEEENQVLVEVIDTGIGIPEEHLPFIFKNFTQADASTTRKFGGTGLGLAICKRLARLMGGKVGVHSQRNKGSTFWFTLPLPLADEAATEEATDSSSVLPPRLRQLSVSGETRARREDSLRGVRVLIVEDNAVNLKLGLKMLQRVGCSYVASAGDGEQCLRVLAEQGPFDVILMDCHMPVMDGLEATRRVRAREQALQLKRTPIIALSASTTPDDIATCMQIGMDDWLGKPFDRALLSATIRRWVPPSSPPPSPSEMKKKEEEKM